MATFTEPVQVGNILVEFEVNKLKHSVKPELKNFFGTYGLNTEQGQFDSYEVPTGTIESVALRRGLAGMKVRGIKVELTSANPVNDFPDISEAEIDNDVDLYEEALKSIVKHNPWLGKKAPYAMVFQPYLPDDEKDASQRASLDEVPEDVDRQDPTHSAPTDTDISGARLMSGSELASQA